MPGARFIFCSVVTESSGGSREGAREKKRLEEVLMRANQAGKVKAPFLPKDNYSMNDPVWKDERILVKPKRAIYKGMVADTGIGVNLKYLGHIFEPFSCLLRKYLIKIIKKKVSC